MHMVVGFLLTQLLKRKRNSEDVLPSWRGEFEVVHQLPGRVRFRVAALEGREEAVYGALAEKLGEVPGIKSVQLNGITGSITVGYDAARIPGPVLCGILLRLLGLSHLPDTRPVSILQEEIREMTALLDRSVHDASKGVLDLNVSLGGTLLALGLYRVLILKERSLPDGPGLLWWALMILRGGNR